MTNRVYQITGSYLLFLALATLLIKATDKGLFLLTFFMPYYTLPMIIISGAYFLWVEMKNKSVNKVIKASAILQLVSLPCFIVALLFGALPCFVMEGQDGLCMLLGTPFLFLAFALWISGFVVLVVGILMDVCKNKSHSK